jgi:hypothetical protein
MSCRDPGTSPTLNAVSEPLEVIQRHSLRDPLVALQRCAVTRVAHKLFTLVTYVDPGG